MEVEITKQQYEAGIADHGQDQPVDVFDRLYRYKKVQDNQDQQQPVQFGHAARKALQFFLLVGRGDWGCY